MTGEIGTSAMHASADPQATPEMCFHCFDTLIDTLHKKKHTSHKRRASASQPAFVEQLQNKFVQCPLFVTWEKRKSNGSNESYQLRGCIGSLTSRVLSSAVGEYAVISALNDKRFSPVTLHEIPFLRVAVSLLVNYEVCNHVYDWEIGVHGILIKFYAGGRSYNGTFLPEVAKEQGWDHRQTLTALIRKAGYHVPVDDSLLSSIHCTRYQSSKCKVPYEVYVKHREGENEDIEVVRPMIRSWNPCNQL